MPSCKEMAKNYSIKSFGGWSSVEGKVFLDGELALVGSIASVQKLDAHADAPFLHSHKEHEELYIIVSGSGEFQVDGEIFPVSEGSFIRVAPEGIRALRNTSDTEMVMICVQYQAKPISGVMEDGVILKEPVRW